MNELAEKIAALRSKIISRAPVTDEELRDAIRAMRGSRESATATRTASKAAAAKPRVDVGALLAQLKGGA